MTSRLLFAIDAQTRHSAFPFLLKYLKWVDLQSEWQGQKLKPHAAVCIFTNVFYFLQLTLIPKIEEEW